MGCAGGQVVVLAEEWAARCGGNYFNTGGVEMGGASGGGEAGRCGAVRTAGRPKSSRVSMCASACLVGSGVGVAAGMEEGCWVGGGERSISA